MSQLLQAPGQLEIIQRHRGIHRASMALIAACPQTAKACIDAHETDTMPEFFRSVDWMRLSHRAGGSCL